MDGYDLVNITTTIVHDITSTTNDTEISALLSFSNWYRQVHGYLACIVCIFGVIANVLNIIVLTRKNMLSPTNAILTGLAFTDALTMAAYFPFALWFYVMYAEGPERHVLPAARFTLFYALFSVLVHSISIWLTVTLALFRYLFIRYPRKGAIYCSIQRAKLAIVMVSIAVSIVVLPNCVAYKIHQDTTGNNTIWYVSLKEDTQTDIIISRLNFWIQATLIKLIPCVSLTLLSIMLIKTMKDAEKRRKKLITKNKKSDDDNRRKKKKVPTATLR